MTGVAVKNIILCRMRDRELKSFFAQNLIKDFFFENLCRIEHVHYDHIHLNSMKTNCIPRI